MFLQQHQHQQQQQQRAAAASSNCKLLPILPLHLPHILRFPHILPLRLAELLWELDCLPDLLPVSVRVYCLSGVCFCFYCQRGLQFRLQACYTMPGDHAVCLPSNFLIDNPVSYLQLIVDLRTLLYGSSAAWDKRATPLGMCGRVRGR